MTTFKKASEAIKKASQQFNKPKTMSEASKELNRLEVELVLIQENIKRVKHRINIGDGVYNAREVGELKHRLIASKSTMTKICNYSTQDYR